MAVLVDRNYPRSFSFVIFLDATPCGESTFYEVIMTCGHYIIEKQPKNVIFDWHWILRHAIHADHSVRGGDLTSHR